MQNPIKSYPHLYNLLHGIKVFSFITVPAAAWFKTTTKEAAKEAPKPRPALARVLSPDCVHLRAGAKQDPLRKNPAP